MNNTFGSAVKDAKDKMVSRESSLTPAVLGIPGTPTSSHGAKLSLNMNSKDKDHLMMKLNEWRNARKEKLIAKIMAKQKPVPHTAPVLSKPKVKPALNSGAQAAQSTSKSEQCNGRTTVFDRLYNQAGKPAHSLSRKTEETSSAKQFSGITKLQTAKTVKPLYHSESRLQNTTVMEGDKTGIQKSSEKSGITQFVMKNSQSLKENVTKEEKRKVHDSNEKSVNMQSVVETEHLPKEENITETRSEPSSSDEKSDSSFNSERSAQLTNAENEESLDTGKKGEEPLLAVCVPKKDESSSQLTEQPSTETNNMDSNDIGNMCQKAFKSPSKRNEEMKQKSKPKLRRSLSTIFRTKSGKYSSAIHRAKSEGSLKSVIEDEEKSVESFKPKLMKGNSKVDNIIRENRDRKLAKNKSVCLVTPKHKTPSAAHLRDKLETWLAEKGHSINTYKHLKCFGLHYEGTPIPSRQAKFDESQLNNSFYSTAPSTPVIQLPDESDKENVTPPVAASKTDVKDVEDLLNDLHNLIVHAKYPRNRCEEWLNAISKRYSKCHKLSVFWECAAAMNLDTNSVRLSLEREESERDEPESSVGSLVQMLDKLAIDEKCDSPRTERGLDVKNIFRSKTVKFALKEKSVKTDSEQGNGEPEKIVVVTPVRRSSRLQTPNKSNVIGSLKSLNPDKRRVSFQPNEALLSP